MPKDLIPVDHTSGLECTCCSFEVYKSIPSHLTFDDANKEEEEECNVCIVLNREKRNLERTRERERGDENHTGYGCHSTRLTDGGPKPALYPPLSLSLFKIHRPKSQTILKCYLYFK